MQPTASSATGSSCGKRGRLVSASASVRLSSRGLRTRTPPEPARGLARTGQPVPPLFRSRAMSRFLLLLLLVCVAACGGRRARLLRWPPRVPPPEPRARRPADARARARRRSRPPIRRCCRPRPRSIRWCPPEELAAELRLAADSAADEAVLEALDDARPADDDAETRPTSPRRRRSPGTSTSTPTTARPRPATTSTSSRARAASAWASGSPACRATRP